MSGARVQDFPSVLSIETWLKDHSALAPLNRRSLATAVSALLPTIDLRHKTSIGIAGAPGSGKSTFARTVAQCLQHSGVPTCVLSLDNYYLSLSRRKNLARDLHPGFLQRGVPGTHDLDWLLADYDRLMTDQAKETRLPIFDKSTDDLAPESQWIAVENNPQVILVEGWCIGASPPDKPERRHPPGQDEAWLVQVEQAWQTLYLELQKRLQQVWYIRVPDWGCVIDWRWQQERELPKMKLKSRLDVETFLASFRAIFQHMQKSYPEWADRVLVADRDHQFQIRNKQ